MIFVDCGGVEICGMLGWGPLNIALLDELTPEEIACIDDALPGYLRFVNCSSEISWFLKIFLTPMSVIWIDKPKFE